ncbi:MFS general substrate transporter [Meredithblackwellia eburnea MCA 4105]
MTSTHNVSTPTLHEPSPPDAAEKGEHKSESSDKIAGGDSHSAKEASLRSFELLAKGEGVKPVFLAKVNVLNQAIQECGMGWYQYKLSISAGFGWFADNIWLQAISILMPYVSNQDGFPLYPRVRLATLALYAGLIAGAAFWGMTCDIVGRRVAWNATLVIGGVFGLAAGASPNFTVLGVLLALMGFGVGGNLPVDGTVMNEFLPGSHSFFLTFLSVWWAIGQVVASLVCWVFVAKYSCDQTLVGTEGYQCNDSNNSGWRYSYYTLGAMMLFLAAVRFFILPMDESPKFLISIGRDKEAVEVVHRIARANGKTSALTLADLHNAALPYMTEEDKMKGTIETKFSVIELARQSLQQTDAEHIRALFSTRRLAYSTSLIILIYGCVGLAYPIFYAYLGSYLSQRNAALGNTSVSATFSAYTYQAACGVIGSLWATYMVTWKRGGRKFAMAFFTFANGVFEIGLAQARTSVQVNALTCMVAITSNAFYGILYAYAPELFPSPMRGTGDALCSSFNRVTGLFAPIIAVYSSAAKTPNGPVYASAGIFLVTGVLMMALPIETAGRTAL